MDIQQVAWECAFQVYQRELNGMDRAQRTTGRGSTLSHGIQLIKSASEKLVQNITVRSEFLFRLQLRPRERKKRVSNLLPRFSQGLLSERQGSRHRRAALLPILIHTFLLNLNWHRDTSTLGGESCDELVFSAVHTRSASSFYFFTIAPAGGRRVFLLV